MRRVSTQEALQVLPLSADDAILCPNRVSKYRGIEDPKQTQRLSLAACFPCFVAFFCISHLLEVPRVLGQCIRSSSWRTMSITDSETGSWLIVDAEIVQHLNSLFVGYCFLMKRFWCYHGSSVCQEMYMRSHESSIHHQYCGLLSIVCLQVARRQSAI